MAETCNHDCSSCKETCGEFDPSTLLEPVNKHSNVKKVIAVMSGKGGVGKSSVTATLAVAMAKRGHKVGILDADITGPSIPQAFGVHTKAAGTEAGILPEVSATGIKIMSLNLLVNNETDPVIWRGAILAAAVKQFWTDVIWGELDYLFLDMPPGTGDVPLTVFQAIPVDGVIVVTSPQDLVSMIVGKAVKMANMMQKPILGLIENYSWFECQNCGEKHFIFGQSRLEQVAEDMNLPILAQIPIDPRVAMAMDEGAVEELEQNYLTGLAERLDN